MKIREIIQKAKEMAKTPEEALLPECFEEYLDLLEMKKKASQEDWMGMEPRLQKSLTSLKEAAEKVAFSYGMSPEKILGFFSNPMNLEPEFADAIHQAQVDEDLSLSKQKTHAPSLKSKRRSRENMKV